MSARAKITIRNWNDPEANYSREIVHCFCATENDWGYSNFMLMKVLCVYDHRWFAQSAGHIQHWSSTS